MQEDAPPSWLASTVPLTLLVSVMQSLGCIEVLYEPLSIFGSSSPDCLYNYLTLGLDRRVLRFSLIENASMSVLDKRQIKSDRKITDNV